MPLDLADQCLDGRSLLRLLAKIKCGICPYQFNVWGFPHSSVGKESACNAGDPGSIPGLGRSAREGIGYPLQSSWPSLVAQQVKNLPSVQETWIRFLGWEDLLEKGTATHSSILECCISFRHMGFPGGTVVKNPTPSAGDARDFGSIPRSGRSPGEGNGNPLQ